MSGQSLNKAAIFFLAAIVSAFLCEVSNFKNLIGLTIFAILMLGFMYYALPPITGE